MRHGEVHQSGPVKYVVISADPHNDTGAAPFVAPILRGVTASTLVVRTGEPDPVSGSVALPMLSAVDPATPGQLIGMLTGSTMARVGDGLRELFAL